MLTVSDIQRALADCGDGVEVKADGRTLLTAQVEGTDPRYLNLVSQPEGVRLPAQATLPEAAQATLPEAAQATLPEAAQDMQAEVVPEVVPETTEIPQAVDPAGSPAPDTDLI